MINDFIKENYGNMTNQELCELIKEKFGEKISKNALKNRWARMKDNKGFEKQEAGDFTEYRADGLMEIQRKIYFDYNEKDRSPEAILRKMGHNPDEWEIIKLRFGTWEVAIKDEETNRLCTTARAEIKPKQKEITAEEALKVARELFDSGLKPFNFPKKKKDDRLDDDKMLELPAVELHLGKLAWEGDTGQNYDHKIAQERFKTIIEETIDLQHKERCGTCFVTIGSDFFNSDTSTNTTTKGTQMQNDVRWKKMFMIGLKLYTEALLTLKQNFNKIDIQICQGNHDFETSWYLFVALAQKFAEDDVITFADDTKTIQAYQFGKCVIFTDHGDGGVARNKRLADDLPNLFPKIWGDTIYREIHKGHQHSEQVFEKSGLISRRMGSPTGKDEYHYKNNWNSLQKQQLFVWDKHNGLLSQKYINFNKKKLTKTR